jgi:hypothetical protein
MSVLDGLEIEHELEKYLGPLLPILFIGLPVLFAIKLVMNRKTIHNSK